MRGKIGKLSTTLLIAFMAISAICVFQASAVPIPPHRFYGSVTIAGEPAPNEILVEAKIENITYANTTTVDGTYGYAPNTFDVPGDDPDTPDKEGGVNGETVDFYIAETYADSYTFESGTFTKLDLVILALPPHADFIANVTSGSEPLTVAFTDLSEYFGVITSWEWDFNNDGVIDSTEQNPVHTYVQNGTYTVSLTVVGDLGTDTETKTDYITVLDTKPVADFYATPTSGYAPLEVNFTDTSTSYDGIVSWSWSFGDEGVSTEKNPIHVYTAVGTYTVTLTVAEADGDTDLETKTDHINATADTTPPSIGTPSQEPPEDNVQPDQAVTVSANVTDAESGVREVILSYSKDGEATWTNVTMNKTTGDTYLGQIPGFPADTNVQYKIIAYDNAENVVTEDNAGQYYVYTVIPEFPTWLSLLLVFLMLTLVIILAKKKIKPSKPVTGMAKYFH